LSAKFVEFKKIKGAISLLLMSRAKRIANYRRDLVNWFCRFANKRFAPLLVVAFVAVIVRVLLLPASTGVLWPDSLTYYQQAEAIADFGRFGVHEIYRTPGFPWFLSLFLSMGDSPSTGLYFVAAQRLLGAATVLFFYIAIRRSFGGEIAFVSGILFGIHELFLYYETVAQTELLFMFFLSLVVLQSTRQFERPSIPGFITLGILLGLLTLTRPIGQCLIILIALIVFYQSRSFRKCLPLCTAMLLAFMLTCLPWMHVNKVTYGFWGISHDIGLNSFHRVFDIEKLDPDENTKYSFMAEKLATVRERAHSSSSYLRLFNQMTRRGRKDLQIDNEMLGLSLETAARHPGQMLFGTIDLWFDYFFESRKSIHFCGSDQGPYLCVSSTVGQSRPGFANAPTFEKPFWLNLVRRIFRVVVLPMVFFSGLGILGAIVYVVKVRPVQPLALFFIGTMLYFSILTAVFNQPEDRFRLPIDPALFAFSSYLTMLALNKLTRRHVRDCNVKCQL
jgi:4-amino-4-deoxy-L-arabinose transferase-like glycosyltransferase